MRRPWRAGNRLSAVGLMAMSEANVSWGERGGVRVKS